MSRKQWGFGNVYLRGRVWWIYYSDHGRMRHESSGKTEQAEAEKFLKKRLAAVVSGDRAQQGNAAVDELLDDLLLDYEINGKRLDWAKIVVAHLRPHFGRWKASRIGTAQIMGYVTARRGKGIANATINRELALLRSAFNKALRHDPPKVSRVPFISKLKEAEARKGFFEGEQLEAIMRHLAADVQDIVMFAHRVGCRRGEILKIRWSQVDFKAGIVRLESGETKNDEARALPMTGDMRSMLERRKKERDARFPACGWVFSRDGQPVKSFTTAWKAACVKAKLTRKDDNEKPERLFHDLRRTAVRNMVRAGVPEKVAMLISGHKTRSVFERYNITNEDDLHAAARKLESYLGEKK